MDMMHEWYEYAPHSFLYNHAAPTLSTHALPSLTPPSTPIHYHAADHDHTRGGRVGLPSPGPPHLSRTLTRIECAKKMKEYSWKNHAG